MAAAASTALAAAGIGIDDAAHLDLYSCFGSSLHFACDALGISPHDARGLTVTGGLPYHGGPGSGYLVHAIAKMTDVLRADPGAFGVVSGVGMHMTKHVVRRLLDDTRRRSPRPTSAAVQRDLDAHPAGPGRRRARGRRDRASPTRSCTAGTGRPSRPCSSATPAAAPGRTRASTDPDACRAAEVRRAGRRAGARSTPTTVAGPMGEVRVNCASSLTARVSLTGRRPIRTLHLYTPPM